MMSRLHLSALLIVFAVIGGAILAINGVSVQLAWLSAVGGTVSGTSIALLAFEHWIWRWGWLAGWFVQRPDLRGTWTVTLNSSWTGPEDQRDGTKIRGYLVVRQTYTTLSLRLLTRESSSKMETCSVIRADDGVFRVIGTYINQSRLQVRDVSPIHFGAIALGVQTEEAMEGSYWTDRLTRGELTASWKTRAQAGSYKEAMIVVREPKTTNEGERIAA